MRTLKQALLGAALAASLSAVAGIASAAPRSPDVYTDGAAGITRSAYPEGARRIDSPRDPYTDGNRQINEARDSYSDGA